MLVSADLKRPDGGADPRTVAPRRGPEVGADVAFDDVLQSALLREPWACHGLYDRYAGRVLGYLRAQRAAEPDDLTSEVFLRVFDRLSQFSGDEMHFRSWLFTIAHRVLIDDARRRQRRPQTIMLRAQEDVFAAGDVEQEALTNVGTDWADELVASLPEDQRAVVALRVTADLPLEEVAQILGKRVGAVKSLQHRALASLRRRFEEASA
jgi:RNA polymerase sigma-70 factor (ECF subfamily)